MALNREFHKDATDGGAHYGTEEGVRAQRRGSGYVIPLGSSSGGENHGDVVKMNITIDIFIQLPQTRVMFFERISKYSMYRCSF